MRPFLNVSLASSAFGITARSLMLFIPLSFPVLAWLFTPEPISTQVFLISVKSVDQTDPQF